MLNLLPAKKLFGGVDHIDNILLPPPPLPPKSPSKSVTLRLRVRLQLVKYFLKIAWSVPCYFPLSDTHNNDNSVSTITLSLCSLLLTISAVICWSINTRMVARIAGILAARMIHQGFLPNGGMIQPRTSVFSLAVRRNVWGNSSFGVFTPTK